MTLSRAIRRSVHVLAIAVAVVVGVSLSATVAVETVWFKQWLRGYIVRAANERLNATLSIGTLSGNLFTGIQVDNVVVMMNGHPVIAVDKVRAGYSIRDIISKGIVVEHVDVTRPNVAMQRDDNGWDLARFIKQKADEANPRGRPIEIRQLTITGGSFSMTRPGEHPMKLEPIDAALTFQYETGHYTFDISRLTLVSTRPDIAVQEAKGVVELREDDLRLGRFSIRTAESAVIVDGEVRRYRSAPVFAMSVHASPLSLPELRRLVPAVGTSSVRPAVDVRLDGPLDRLATDFSMQSSSGSVAAKGVAGVGGAERSFEGKVAVRRLNLAPFLDNPEQRSDIDADATLRVRSADGLERLRGDVVLNAPRFHLREYVVDDVKARARLSGRTIAIESSRAHAFGADATAAGTVSFPADAKGEMTFDLRGQVKEANLRKLPPSMRVPPADTRIAGAYHVIIAVPRGRPGTRLTGEATLEPSTVAGAEIANGATVSFGVGAGELSYQVDATLANLDLRRIGDEFHIQTLAAERYRGRLNGHVNASVRGADIDTMELQATGRLETASLFAGEFTNLDFETTIKDGGLRVKANGQVDSVDLGIAADKPSLKGSVTGTIDTDVTFAHVSRGITLDSVDAEVTADLEPSNVGHVAIDRASVAGEYHNALADVQRLEVTGADITATGHGTLSFSDSGQSGFWIHAETSRLQTIGDTVQQPVSGIATVDAVVGGNRQAFVARGTLTGEGLKYRDYGALTSASKFTAKIQDLDWRQTDVTADTRATFVDMPGLHVNEVSAKTDYVDRRVKFDFTASQPQRTLAAAGSLEFRPEDQEIRLERLRFDTQGLTWQTEPGHVPIITYGPSGVGVMDFNLVNGDQRISTEGLFGKSGERLTLTLEHVDLGIIDAWLLRKPQLFGRVNAKAEISGQPDALAVATDFQVDNGRFRDVPYQSFSGHVNYSRDAADVDAKLQQNASQWLTAKGHVPLAAFRANKKSDDRFDLHVDSSEIDLGLVQGLTPAIDRVKGTLQAKFDVTGASDEPRVAGAVNVKGGAFTLVDTGVSYTGLDGRIDLLPDRIHIDDLHVLDNHYSQLTASGDLNVSGLQVGEVNLYFTAQDFKVLDNEMGNLRLHSDLRLTGTLAHPRIEGEVDVSTGSINLDPILARIADSPYATTAAETSAPGGEEKAPPAEGTWRNPQLSVHLVIPDDLVVKAKDLKTGPTTFGIGLGAVNLTLGGDLNVSANAGRPITLVGAVTTVRGYYDFQGRRFQILRDGTVRFEGDPVNQLDPALNVVGERVIQAVTARVNVRGRLKRPEIELTSTPPLEQSDILALIVFNQPINQLGAGQQVSLAQRAGVMAAGAVTSELTNSIAESLRIDQFEINVAPDPGVAAELVLGQQLSQNLYVKVQQGLGDRTQTNLILEYEFAKWLRLQTNVLQGASTQQQLFQRVQSTGVDLVFSFSFK